MKRPTTDIIVNISKIISKQDKNGREYLVVETDQSHIIFVFDRIINSSSWKELQVGQSYQFTLETNPSGTHTATDFTKTVSFSWPQ